MDADRRRYRFRVGAFLAWAPMLALVVALAWWVLSLRSQVELLESRVATLESLQATVVSLDVSEVGVPRSVDEAMLMDGVATPERW